MDPTQQDPTHQMLAGAMMQQRGMGAPGLGAYGGPMPGQSTGMSWQTAAPNPMAQQQQRNPYQFGGMSAGSGY